MLNNNGHQNSHCAYAEQLASYLYNEIAAPDKIAFESHLPNCAACAADLTDFSALRSSIIEWREMDFDLLPTPHIVLPTTRENGVKKRSLFDAIRSFFNFSTAQAAFAVVTALLLTGGLFWLVANYSRHENSGGLEIAEKEKPRIENSQLPLPAPTAERFSKPDNQTPDNSAASQNSANGVKDSGARINSAPIKQSAPTAIPVVQRSSGKQVLVKPGTNPRIKTPDKNNQPPVDEDDDDDDNSLRLSDLFEEVGMAKTPAQEDNVNDK